MGAGLLGGGLLIGLWISLVALAGMFQLPVPAPGLLALGLLVGGGLFREGLRIAQGEPDVPLPRVEGQAIRRMWALLLMLIGGGASAEALAPQWPLLVLPFHLGVAALGPLMWFSVLRWRLQAPWSRRAMWWGLGVGSFLVPALTVFLEALAGIGLALLLVLSRVLLEGPEFLQRWLPKDLSPEGLSAFRIERLLGDPWLWIGVLIGAAGVIPAIEEAIKPLPAVLRLRDRRVSEATLILYGALGGAGFSLAENLLSWQPGIPWAFTAIGRVGTAGLHVLNGGVMGWAWSRMRRGRFLEGIGGYLLAWLLHSLWNAGVIVLSGALSAPLSTEARALTLFPALLGLGIALLLLIGGLGWALPMWMETESEAVNGTLSQPEG